MEIAYENNVVKEQRSLLPDGRAGLSPTATVSARGEHFWRPTGGLTLIVDGPGSRADVFHGRSPDEIEHL